MNEIEWIADVVVRVEVGGDAKSRDNRMELEEGARGARFVKKKRRATKKGPNRMNLSGGSSGSEPESESANERTRARVATVVVVVAAAAEG